VLETVAENRVRPYYYRICGGRTTGNGAKIWTGNKKSLVEVRRKSAKMLDFSANLRILGPFWQVEIWGRLI